MTPRRYVLSMWEGKHKPPEERGLSQLRVITTLFAIAFICHWPERWDGSTVTAMALILLAPSIDALLFRVPVAESVEAVQAIFQWLGARARAGAARAAEGMRETMPSMTRDRDERP